MIAKEEKTKSFSLEAVKKYVFSNGLLIEMTVSIKLPTTNCAIRAQFFVVLHKNCDTCSQFSILCALRHENFFDRLRGETKGFLFFPQNRPVLAALGTLSRLAYTIVTPICYIASRSVSASARSLSSTWIYVLYIVEIFACPIHLLTTLIATPAFKTRGANVCLN